MRTLLKALLKWAVLSLAVVLLFNYAVLFLTRHAAPQDTPFVPVSPQMSAWCYQYAAQVQSLADIGSSQPSRTYIKESLEFWLRKAPPLTENRKRALFEMAADFLLLPFMPTQGLEGMVASQCFRLAQTL